MRPPFTVRGEREWWRGAGGQESNETFLHGERGESMWGRGGGGAGGQG